MLIKTFGLITLVVALLLYWPLGASIEVVRNQVAIDRKPTLAQAMRFSLSTQGSDYDIYIAAGRQISNGCRRDRACSAFTPVILSARLWAFVPSRKIEDFLIVEQLLWHQSTKGEEFVQACFGKKLSELTLAEEATLAARSRQYAQRNPAKLTEWRDMILRRMFESNEILEPMFLQAISQPTVICP